MTTYKLWVRIPKTATEALSLDAANGNTLCKDAIQKEMKNVWISFELCANISDVPKGYQKIECHMIFDVKLRESFRHKTWFVAGGHTTITPAFLTYSSVVYRNYLRTALLLAALHGVEVKSCNIQNAYLSDDCLEKLYIIVGAEFGEEHGTVMIIRQALYGIRSSGKAFRSFLTNHLWDSGFRPTEGDLEVHIRTAITPDGYKYYEIIVTYVDDIIGVSYQAEQMIWSVITNPFTIKKGVVAAPEICLGAQLEHKKINHVKCWTMTSQKYIQADVN